MEVQDRQKTNHRNYFLFSLGLSALIHLVGLGIFSWQENPISRLFNNQRNYSYTDNSPEFSRSYR